MGKGKATSLGRNHHRFARWPNAFDPGRTSNPGCTGRCTHCRLLISLYRLPIGLGRRIAAGWEVVSGSHVVVLDRALMVLVPGLQLDHDAKLPPLDSIPPPAIRRLRCASGWATRLWLLRPPTTPPARPA